MPTIDLGVNYEDVQDLDKYPVVPGGTYTFIIKKAENMVTKSNRPKIFWALEITDPDTGHPVSIPHNTVLPWIKDGQQDVSGVGMLVQVCKAVGLPWAGGKINTDDYIGRGGKVEVKQVRARMQDPTTGEWTDDPSGELQNMVKKFVY